VEHALSAKRPKARYLVGADARLLGGIVTRLPDPLRDLTVAAVTQVYARVGRHARPGDAPAPAG